MYKTWNLCKSTQISCFVPFLRMYLSMQVDSDFSFCTLSAYVPLYASRHRFHVLYLFCVCSSLCKLTQISCFVPFLRMYLSMQVDTDFTFCTVSAYVPLYASRHRFHVLYLFCVCSSLCKSTQISCFVPFLRMYLSMQVDTDFMFCTFSAYVPLYASRHRFHVLYLFCVCSSLCKSTQISCFVPFLRMYLSMQVDTNFTFCTLSAYVPLYASRHRFHVLYLFCVCSSPCKSTQVSCFVPFLRMYLFNTESLFVVVF